MLELVGGNDRLHCCGNTLDETGEDGGVDGAPGSDRVRVFSQGSAAFVYECEGCNHFGEALIAF